MRVPKNHTIVEVESLFEDTFTTPGGLLLHTQKEETAERYHDARTHGTIRAMFAGLSDRQKTMCEKPSRDWRRVGGYKGKDAVDNVADYTYLEGTFADMRVGDVVHFRITAMLAAESGEMWMGEELGIDGAGKCIKVLADDILCVERPGPDGGELIAVGGKVLIEPIEITEKVTSKVLIIPETGETKKKNTNMGRLISKSKPMKGFLGIEPEPGDVVIYKQKIAEYINVNGRKVEVMYLTEVDAWIPGNRFDEAMNED